MPTPDGLVLQLETKGIKKCTVHVALRHQARVDWLPIRNKAKELRKAQYM